MIKMSKTGKSIISVISTRSKISIACAGVIVVGLLSLSSFAAETVLINGAGATFPYPLYAKWFSTYREVDKSVEFNYQSIGSGGGIRQFLAGTTDFGASDAPMKDDELAQSKVPILHIPATLGAVAVTFNLPGVKDSLNLTPEVLSKIFMGDIKKWDDEEILKLNPKVVMPKNQYIIVCYRSDGSGTTAVFTEYLEKVSPDWKKRIGSGKSVKWPAGLGGKGNEGVSSLVKQNPGSIGYVEMNYAFENKFPVFAIKNAKGDFVLPSVKSVTKAAEASLKSLPEDFRVSITEAAGSDVYPISAYTYLLIYQKMESHKGKKIVEFLKWSMGKGQTMASGLNYAPLPNQLVKRVLGKIDTIVLEGSSDKKEARKLN